MAKKKGRRRKPRLITRAINAGLLALAFWPAIQRVLIQRQNPAVLLDLYSAGIASGVGRGGGQFSRALAAEAYGPIVAAFVLFEIKKMAMRKFRI